MEMLGGMFRGARAAQRGARQLARLSGVCLLGAAVMAFALALAVLGADRATASGGPTALPDGRAYEQASSQKKNGNEAGVIVFDLEGTETTAGAYTVASP